MSTFSYMISRPSLALLCCDLQSMSMCLLLGANLFNFQCKLVTVMLSGLAECIISISTRHVNVCSGSSRVRTASPQPHPGISGTCCGEVKQPLSRSLRTENLFCGTFAAFALPAILKDCQYYYSCYLRGRVFTSPRVRKLSWKPWKSMLWNLFSK